MLSLIHKGCLLAVALFAGADAVECMPGDEPDHRSPIFSAAVATELVPMVSDGEKREVLPDNDGFFSLGDGSAGNVLAFPESLVAELDEPWPSSASSGEDLPRGPPSRSRELVS